MSRTLHLEPERGAASAPPPMVDPHMACERDEIARLKELLSFSARQMAELRRRNEQLMGINSDLRCKLGEMTLRWVDLCNRTGV
ncbi:MAG: hypothetical protein ACJ8GK_07585 [Luteimonas sp.]